MKEGGLMSFSLKGKFALVTGSLCGIERDMLERVQRPRRLAT